MATTIIDNCKKEAPKRKPRRMRITLYVESDIAGPWLGRNDRDHAENRIPGLLRAGWEANKKHNIGGSYTHFLVKTLKAELLSDDEPEC